MRADHVLRPLGRLGDLVHVQRGRIRCEDRAGLGDAVELAEEVLLYVHPLEHGFDDDVGIARRVEVGARSEERHALVHLLLLQPALRHGGRIVLFYFFQTPVERFLRRVGNGDRDADVDEAHRDAAAHRARADDGRFL